jgi:hypothetical protein
MNKHVRDEVIPLRIDDARIFLIHKKGQRIHKISSEHMAGNILVNLMKQVYHELWQFLTVTRKRDNAEMGGDERKDRDQILNMVFKVVRVHCNDPRQLPYTREGFNYPLFLSLANIAIFLKKEMIFPIFRSHTKVLRKLQARSRVGVKDFWRLGDSGRLSLFIGAR